MLELAGVSFTQGRSKFSDHAPGFPEPTAKIYVRVLLGQSSRPALAQLDTGAAWSVMPPQIAREAGVPLASDRPVLLNTRLGIKKGHLVRAPLIFVAEQGEATPQLPAKKKGKIRILLVICRPRAEEDVPFRSVASQLIRGLS